MDWIVVFDLLVKLLVGAVLLVGGLAKISMTSGQRHQWLGAYRLLPRHTIPAVSMAIPLVESSVGLSLVLGMLGSVSKLAAAGLLLAISGAAVLALARGESPECGCFGRLSNELLSARIVVRNLALVVLLLVDVLLFRSHSTLPTDGMLVALGVAVGLLVIGLWLARRGSLRHRATAKALPHSLVDRPTFASISSAQPRIGDVHNTLTEVTHV